LFEILGLPLEALRFSYAELVAQKNKTPMLSDKEIADAKRYGCEVLGAMGYGKVINEFGRIPATAALDMGRALMRAHPQADAIFLPSPHWPVTSAIEPLEREFGVTVMAASQACIWDALRLVGVNERIEGYGRLLRQF
jgi:maleate isomerase